jgi:glycosyltransferase involved in cell wall biosynthesis
LEVIGARPANWTVHRFGAMEALPFLRRLDFFVHYPQEDYIEEFGRAALEAIAAGVPAVLPPVFRESFGEAAVYAEPDEVWDRIEALWRDEAAYLAQARRGRDFVRENSGWAGFADRLARTVGKARA